MTATKKIDESNLTVTCDSLMSELTRLYERVEQVKAVCDRLKAIQRPDGEDGTAKPLDTRTGAYMTDATRLEIYNAVIADADKLLAPPTEEESD